MTRLSDTQLVILSAAAQREDLSVLPLPDGLALDTAVAAVRGVATSGAPVIGFGATAVMRREDTDMDATIDAIAALAEAALAASENGETRSG